MSDDHTIGSGPIEAEFAQTMKAIGYAIDAAFNDDDAKRETGFILLVFKFDDTDKPGPKGRCNYLSNARREDVITLLKEQLSYFEGMSDTHAEGHA